MFYLDRARKNLRDDAMERQAMQDVVMTKAIILRTCMDCAQPLWVGYRKNKYEPRKLRYFQALCGCQMSGYRAYSPMVTLL